MIVHESERETRFKHVGVATLLSDLTPVRGAFPLPETRQSPPSICVVFSSLPNTGLVSYLVLEAQSITKGYIRAEHKLHSVSKLFISQVMIPQVMDRCCCCCFLFFYFCLFIFRVHSKREPASRRVTYFILRAYTGTGVSHSQRRKKNRERFLLKKMQMNGLQG